MVASLNQTQQERVYKSFQRTWFWIVQTQMDGTTRRKQIDDSRGNLQQRVNEKDLRGLHLQEAMLEYLLIREHEEALYLPQTPVPVILLPHFQNISYPDLQAVVNRLAVFPASAVPVIPPQPARATAPAAPSVAASQEAKNEELIDSYNAVRAGRITHPETIRELAWRFFEIENDPETSQNFPYDAGEAARILLRRAKLYEDQADMPGRRRGQEAKNEELINSYDAVRAGRITRPETIRELAWRFFEIENDPETSQNFPYDAGEAARILLRRAKLYEDQADMPGRRRGNDNLMEGGG